MYFLL